MRDAWMRDTGRPEGHEELEVALSDLAAHVALPDGTGVARAVRARLDSAASIKDVRPRRAWSLRGATLRGVVLALVGSVVLAGAAVAIGLGLRGLRIAFVDELPAVPSAAPGATTGAALGLGSLTTLDEARRDAGFRVVVPSTGGLERPDEVYLIRREPSNVVSLVYAARPHLPPAGPSGVGSLLMQFRGGIDEDYMKSLLEGGAVMRRVEVQGQLGFWIEGVHVLRYIGPDRRQREEPARLVGNVLVWQRGDLLLRLETGGPMEEALRVAASVR